MEPYKNLPLWQKAFTVGKEIDELTKNFPEYNTILRFLRERSTAMPVTIATGSIGGTPAEYAEALKTVYEQAHDTEYLLFFTLIFRYLPYENICTLSEQIHDVKWLVIEAISGQLLTGKIITRFKRE